MQFECPKCGSPAVRIPAELSLTASVECARCGSPIGTWSDLQDLAALREREAQEGGRVLVRADPISAADDQ
jgi:DNA-directed RNA polymerase subunit RPC12/RpoP